MLAKEVAGRHFWLADPPLIFNCFSWPPSGLSSNRSRVLQWDSWESLCLPGTSIASPSPSGLTHKTWWWSCSNLHTAWRALQASHHHQLPGKHSFYLFKYFCSELLCGRHLKALLTKTWSFMIPVPPLGNVRFPDIWLLKHLVQLIP